MKPSGADRRGRREKKWFIIVLAALLARHVMEDPQET